MTHESRVNVLSVDFSKEVGRTHETVLKYKKGDVKTSYIELKLLNNEVPINLEGYHIVPYIITNDCNRVSTDCTVLDSIGGSIEIQLPTNTIVQGKNYMEISLIKEDTQLISPIISYEVAFSLSNMLSEDIENSTNLPILVKLISDVEKIKREYDSLTFTQSDIEEVMRMIK